MRRPTPTFLQLALCALLAAVAAPAQAKPPALADLSLEDLNAVEVTSVGKRVQRLADVAGAVFVIRAEDIRRSGATTLADALRLAPNLFVAKADAAQYAVTARTGADLLANKLLVQIDGRTVYSPLFSGVFWEAQDLVLEDVERIEVLSGSGGTLYGSNAFNGVINIVTRSAADTPGLLASATTGSRTRVVSARHGGGTTSAAWRVYARHHQARASVPATTNLIEEAERAHAGFRMDARLDARTITLHGDVFEHRLDERDRTRRYAGASFLGRGVEELADGSRVQLQAYLDRATRNRPGAIADTLDTLDLEAQRQSRPRPGHELLLGAGWRRHHDRSSSDNPDRTAFWPAQRDLQLWNVFAQDEMTVASAVKLTLGLKAEHNSYTGLEWLPSARLAWAPAPGQLWWGGLSRTVRTPARIDRDLSAFPLQLSPNFQSEVARVAEVGWRGQITSSLSAAATLFHHNFSRLRSYDVVAGQGTFNNNYEGRLVGLDVWTDWRVTEHWRLRTGYSAQQIRYDALAGTNPAPPGMVLGNDPRHRASVGLSWDVSRDVELDLNMRRVGALAAPSVPAYVTGDLRLGWRVQPSLELSLTARNFTDHRHLEWALGSGGSEVHRELLLKAVWNY